MRRAFTMFRALPLALVMVGLAAAPAPAALARERLDEPPPVR